MSVVWSLTPMRRDRVGGGVVAVREGDGKGCTRRREDMVRVSAAAVSSTQQSIWRDRVKDNEIR